MSNIVAGLLITLIGMGLVFLSLALLWGLMILMVKVTNRFFPDKEEEEGAGEDIDNGAELVEASPEADLRAQAAAAAVAVKLSTGPHINSGGTAAMTFTLTASESALDALVAGAQNITTSSWQAIHRANRLNQRLNLFSRKAGRN